MQCPKCHSKNFKKNGRYDRKSDGQYAQRYKCRDCHKSFSSQTFAFNRWQKKAFLNETIYKLLAKGMSQRACAEVLKIHPATVDSRISFFGEISKKFLAEYWESKKKPRNVQFDEAESFIHSKCKPVTIPIAVEKKTRRIITFDVGNICGKGHLAKIAKIRYPEHKSEKKQVLNSFFKVLKTMICEDAKLSSDKSTFYPPKVKEYFPKASYKQYKGRRGCVVGQGELKAGGFDPLFSLNHTIAMIRDNLKRMTRRTWCTTKLKEKLINLINIYALYHNIRIDEKLAKKVRSAKRLLVNGHLLAPLF